MKSSLSCLEVCVTLVSTGATRNCKHNICVLFFFEESSEYKRLSNAILERFSQKTVRCPLDLRGKSTLCDS